VQEIMPLMKEEKYFKMNKKYNLLFIVYILIAGVIAYSNSFDCSFHFDDNNIFKSSFTGDTASIGDWLHLHPARPIGMLTFAMNYNIHKLDVWGYHLVNLIIHLINALLVWWLTFITFSTPAMKDTPISGQKNEIAFLTSLLFVTHPLATQSVTYIVQRFTSLATLFYLLSLILFAKGRLRESIKTAPFLFCASIVFGICGVLTKEIVFTLPFAIILYDYCFIKTFSWKPDFKDKRLIFSLVMLVIFILFFLTNYSLNIFNTVQPTPVYSYSISMKEYFFTQFQVILTYIRLFILPFNQNLDYDYPVSAGFFQLKTIFSLSVLLGILTASVLMFKKYRLISFGIFWFFLTLSVESSIIPISQDVIYEHRTYLPGIGFFLAMTGAFFYYFREKYFHVAVIIILMISTVNTALTYQRNKIWKNDYTLWADCAEKSPNKVRVHTNLGVAHSEFGQYQLAIKGFSEAIRLNPDLAEAYNNRGSVFSILGQYQMAIKDLSEAIRLKPDFAEAYSNRGGAYLSQSNNELGCLDAQKACELGNCQLLELAKGKGDCR
jgi:tetratricopeptide (TPR) repeat protein